MSADHLSVFAPPAARLACGSAHKVRIQGNGQHPRWADGTQTCFGRKANASTNTETIIFPASFVNGSVPVCTLTAERNNNGDHPLVTLRTVTASNMTTQSNAFPALHNVHWTATGRWF